MAGEAPSNRANGKLAKRKAEAIVEVIDRISLCEVCVNPYDAEYVGIYSIGSGKYVYGSRYQAQTVPNSTSDIFIPFKSKDDLIEWLVERSDQDFHLDRSNGLSTEIFNRFIRK